ncbi:DNA-directed RNA polymerase subunit B'' [Candidatus Woesearchaeota archaeon]|jgi:DNA-directed RNA polymerase beta subunit|nr:DNA-directed RNA polymerase subunit B'' [Candidatus Woesearchaeota archaeon]MBT4387842.1 DNA-directed RNA polymerase subunit B'' [Candidatus Woesearchaeota archaeon]MBT4595661.1 DNA-directed RNA polymerase subunit B'' [Candidatus Woesearchaeota archaeon]MBT5740856.1 DNA-directed RNA polymerase subunit B'' [Candidatus Woesearchaeota archaeon]MBT6505605.1 DNA-directed RNA polymerase subunit B'' [Candidatus Woesearchaeota archaeon]
MNDKKQEILIRKYFQENNFASSNIASYNNFIENELANIISELQEIKPTIIPHDIDEFEIKFDKIWVEPVDKHTDDKGPTIVEADGSKRKIFPNEARLRKLSYVTPVYANISAHINGVQRESFTTELCQIPVMLRSKYCHLNGFNKDDLVNVNEDPYELGGYFIIAGTEKTLVAVEDLAPDKLMVDGAGSAAVGKLYSEFSNYRIPHTVELSKDGILTISFARYKKIPLVPILKSLGFLKDSEIAEIIDLGKDNDTMFINLYEFVELKTEEDALDFLSKKMGINQTRETRLIRAQDILDKALLPHLGTSPQARIFKAYNISKYIKRYIDLANKKYDNYSKDHYANKKLKLAGPLLGDLFRFNLKVLINDLLFNFQRIVKRGKFPSIKVIIRNKLLTKRINSAMATGNWVAGRKGISQRIQRINYHDYVSSLQRVVSLLSTTQENFDARSLHCTHMGRLCPIETPEGTNVGLKKNLSILARISNKVSNKEELLSHMREAGLKTIF